MKMCNTIVQMKSLSSVLIIIILYTEYAVQIYEKIKKMKDECVKSDSMYPEEKQSFLQKRQLDVEKVKDQLVILERKMG